MLSTENVLPSRLTLLLLLVRDPLLEREYEHRSWRRREVQFELGLT